MRPYLAAVDILLRLPFFLLDEMKWLFILKILNILNFLVLMGMDGRGDLHLV